MELDGEQVETPWINLSDGDTQFPLQDGAVVFGIGPLARTPEAEASLRHRINFEIAFGYTDVVDGQPLIPTLRDLVTHAAQVVEPLIARVAA